MFDHKMGGERISAYKILNGARDRPVV